MKLAVLADELLRNEFNAKTISGKVEIEWAGSLKILMATPADAYFDLLFEHDDERNKLYNMRKNYPLFVNSVVLPAKVIGKDLIRINAWPGMLDRKIIELAAVPAVQSKAFPVMDALGWPYQFVPDIAGMITPRIIASIINEAYFTLGDRVSTRDEIDIAMKLGTNYPKGPFEWGDQIGLSKIAELLGELSRTDPRYMIAPAMKQALEKLTA